MAPILSVNPIAVVSMRVVVAMSARIYRGSSSYECAYLGGIYELVRDRYESISSFLLLLLL